MIKGCLTIFGFALLGLIVFVVFAAAPEVVFGIMFLAGLGWAVSSALKGLRG